MDLAPVLLNCFASFASSLLDYGIRILCTEPGSAMLRADTHLPEGVAAINQLISTPHETTLKAALHTRVNSCQTVPVCAAFGTAHRSALQGKHYAACGLRQYDPRG